MPRNIAIPQSRKNSKEIQEDIDVQTFLRMNPDEAEAWINDNVINIPDIKEVLVVFARYMAGTSGLE